MSFSGDVKTELCRVPLNRPCCLVAEAYGVLLFANCFKPQQVRIVTASVPFAQRLPRLFQKAFGVSFDSVSEAYGGKTVLEITEREKIRKIYAAFGYDADGVLAHHINLGILEEDCCRASFLRGAFLAGGSITDPSKRCHLELVTDHKNVSGETVSLLLEMGFQPGETVRAGHYVLYFKKSEAVEDIFTTIGAQISSLEMMNAKVEKDMRNAINRRVNCDTANADKIVSAAQGQIDRIRELMHEEGLENLPKDLAEVALLRLANPEASLSDLAMLADPPVSKSCMNHRLRKLMNYRTDSDELSF